MAKPRAADPGPSRVRTVLVHGHRLAYVRKGRGPVLLLLHGLASDHRTWDPVLPLLARHFTVVAPDLLGHGASDKPRADYSVAGYANGVRDLLDAIGVDRATVVGHSLGGGVAMQLAYQFPHRVERLVLVAPGGLGPEVTPLLRAMTLPGGGLALEALSLWPVRRAGGLALTALTRTGLPRFRDGVQLARVYEELADRGARRTLRQALRGTVGWRGQLLTVEDRAYLAAHVPMCVVWGHDDTVLPVRHTEVVARLMPHARVAVVEDAGHFPYREHPRRFTAIVREFVAGTRPEPVAAAPA